MIRLFEKMCIEQFGKKKLEYFKKQDTSKVEDGWDFWISEHCKNDPKFKAVASTWPNPYFPKKLTNCNY
jgi:hypothetical protein